MSVHVEDLFCGSLERLRAVAAHKCFQGNDAPEGGVMVFCGDADHVKHGPSVRVDLDPLGVDAVEFYPGHCGCTAEAVSRRYAEFDIELAAHEAGLHPPSEAAAKSNGRGKSHLTGFDEIVAKPVRWAWQDRAALAKITALAGRPKIGKGLLYSHLLAAVTRGELPGDLDGPRDAILVTTEDEPGDTLKPRLMAAGADLSRVSMFQMGAKDAPVPFRVPQDAAELGSRVAERSAALVVIDPLMEFIDGSVDSHKSHKVRQAIAAVNQIAREHGCAVMVIFHLNKGISTDPLVRHEGSAAFTQIVRGGLMLGHDPDDPDGEDGSQRVLAVSSSNLAAISPSLVYRIDTARVIGDTGEEITTASMEPIGESAAGAHDLLRGHQDEDERVAGGEAEHFLREELSDGPRPAGEVEAEARKIGIARTTLFRARRTLGVVSEKSGFKGGWQWSLPEGATREGSNLVSVEAESSEPSASQAGSRPPQGSQDSIALETGSSRPTCSCLRPDPGLDGQCQRCWGLAPGGAS